MTDEDIKGMTDDRPHVDVHDDSWADAVASIILVAVFVVASIYWISGQ